MAAIASSTRCRFSGPTKRNPRSTFETVAVDTPAAAATSRMVGRLLVAICSRTRRALGDGVVMAAWHSPESHVPCGHRQRPLGAQTAPFRQLEAPDRT